MTAMTPTQPVPPGQPVPPKKKTSPIVWILIGVVAFMFIAVVLAVGTLYFVGRKVARDITSNPAGAVTRLIAAANPDVDVLKYDETRGIITVRDKKTGKTFTMNFEDVKNGKFVMQEEGKPAVTMETSASGLEVKSAEGNLKIGAGGKAPDWVPGYPGSNPEGTFGMQGNDGETGSYHFKTKDAADKILSFYSDALGKAGLKVNSTTTSENGKTSGGMVMGEDESKKRSAMVTVGTEEGESTVSVTFSVKK